MTLKVRLLLLCAIFAAGLAIVSAIAVRTVVRVRVNGPLYEQIVTGKALLSDVRVPALTGAEALLVAQQLADETDEETIAKLAARAAEVEKRFDETAQTWASRLEGDERARVLELQQKANPFFHTIAKELVPASQSGKIQATQAALDRTRKAYAAFAAYGAEVVQFLEQRQREHEAAASDAVVSGGWVLGLAILAVLLSGAALAFGVIQRIGRSVGGLVAQTHRLTEAVAQGDLTLRADPAAVDPEFQPMVAGVNETVDALVRPLRVTAGYVERISQGDVPPPVTEDWHGDFDQVKQSLNRCIAAVTALVDDAGHLAEAGAAGQLQARADAARHQGSFRRVVEGVNATLDAVVRPVRDAAERVERLSRGEIPEDIRDAWAGDLSRLRDALNRCFASVRALSEDARRLATAGAEGRLDVRADGTRHAGDFQAIVEGVNATLDAVVGPLREAAAAIEALSKGEAKKGVGAAWKGEFVTLRAALERSTAAVGGLVQDASAVARGAAAGQLSLRADAARHLGEFRAIVEQLNKTLDAVAAPATATAHALERLARRDMTARVDGAYEGDHARTQVALDEAAGALQEALLQVRTAVSQVANAAVQIASTAQSVSQGATTQAASLERTTSDLGALAGGTREAADQAKAADGLVREAAGAARTGAAAVDRMGESMQRIRQSAESTSAIIKDINEIAFQTNLLALNAAVEAARAGDAGRGFAVVAEEVRALAMRSKEAAQKTEALIHQSVEQSMKGEEAAKDVSARLADIVRAVDGSTERVGRITTLMGEQVRRADGLSATMGEVDKVTQQNAASAEEASAAAEELSAQAQELEGLVGKFELGDGGAARSSASPRRRLAARRELS
ncbi:MAG: methyl-accepting chemotaxis protein [Anaeromyxobacter sp.]